MNTYSPYNWYWAVAETSKVFSSAVGDYVANDAPAFVAWKEAGNVPQPIETEAALGEVLSPYNLRPASAPVLDAYKDHQAKELTIKTVAKALFFMANEIRVLQGKNALTPAQFRGWLKDLM